MRHEYVIGNIYGCLKLLRLFKDKNQLMAEVECIHCHKIKTKRARELYNEKNNSCLCRIKTHGMNRTKIYSIYNNMKDRCYNNNHHEFHNYGGKGVVICDEWLGKNGFINFMNWAYKNGYVEGLSIDRIDSNGNYEPNNCQWITRSENTIKANKTSQHRKANKGTYYGISPSGEKYEFENAAQFGREHNLNDKSIRRAANSSKGMYKGWKFGFISELNKESD